MAVQIVKYVGETLTVYATIINHGPLQTIYVVAHLHKPGTTYSVGLGSSIQPDNPVTLEPGGSVDVNFVGEIWRELDGLLMEAGLYDVKIEVGQMQNGGVLVAERVLVGEVEIRLDKKEILDPTYA